MIAAKLDPTLCRELAADLTKRADGFPRTSLRQFYYDVSAQLTAAADASDLLARMSAEHRLDLQRIVQLADALRAAGLEVPAGLPNVDLAAIEPLTEELVRKVVEQAVVAHLGGIGRVAADAIATRAAKELAGAAVEVRREEEFVALREALARRLAEVNDLHPVVVAAHAWRDDPCKGLGSHKETDLAAAVDYYRAQRRIAPALDRAAVAITVQPAAGLTEQLKPATASIGPADTASFRRRVVANGRAWPAVTALTCALCDPRARWACGSTCTAPTGRRTMATDLPPARVLDVSPDRRNPSG